MVGFVTWIAGFAVGWLVCWGFVAVISYFVVAIFIVFDYVSVAAWVLGWVIVLL